MKLTYANKVAINENAEIPNINKITDDDMNEIKTVVNNNDDDMITINTKLTNATTYSTDEIRVGTWMNKPLYRKVFVLTVENNSDIIYNHNLTNIDMFRVNQGESFIYNESESLPATWYYSSSDWGRTWMKSTTIRFRSPSSLGSRTLYVVIEYTKTTD